MGTFTTEAQRRRAKRSLEPIWEMEWWSIGVMGKPSCLAVRTEYTPYLARWKAGVVQICVEKLRFFWLPKPATRWVPKPGGSLARTWSRTRETKYENTEGRMGRMGPI